MPATSNKQRVLTGLFSALKKSGESSGAESRPVLEQFIYGLLREGATREQADSAYRALQERFFDWNEIRVSSAREVEEALANLPGAAARSERLIAFLQEVFETTFSFDLEPLQKKGLKQGAKALTRYQAHTNYTVAWVVQQSLGGHAIPVDAPTLRVTRRLGLVEGDDETAAQAALEHLVPKARGGPFVDLMSALADEVCHEDEPNCPACLLCSECPTAQESQVERLTAARPARPTKPR